MGVQAKADAFLELVDESAEVEQLGTGFTFTEGPIWNPDGFLLFSDMPGDVRRRWDPDSGVTEVANPSNKPNGLCFSTDESLLYINDTTRAHIRVFDVADDGTISNSRVLADGIGSGSLEIGDLVDGMKLDKRGNVWVTGPGGVCVFDSDGNHIGTVEVPENVGNVNCG